MIRNIINQQKEERDFLIGKKYIDRLEQFPVQEFHNTNLIKLITGPRRAGKSVLALQLLKNCEFAYLNFDDEPLLKNFEENQVIQSLKEVYGPYEFLMLDEIQNLPGWELWVNKLYRRDVNLVITGSNSRLLSNEMATSLTGRYLSMMILPFSFGEFLKASNEVVPDQAAITPSRLGEILNILKIYLFNGGFPEIVFYADILRNYLSALFDSVLLKDILSRFQIRDSRQLYDLSYYLLSNYTNPYTANQLKSVLGLNSVATIQKFVRYLEEPFLFVSLPCYTIKIKLQQKLPRKSYIIDNGFIKARSFELSPNYGRLFENMIFIELLRRNFKPGLDLFYYRTRNDREVDFLLRSGYKVSKLIQVCYDISGTKALKRETDALFESAGELSCNQLLMLTWDTEDILTKNGFTINMIPAWRWLIEPTNF